MKRSRKSGGLEGSCGDKGVGRSCGKDQLVKILHGQRNQQDLQQEEGICRMERSRWGKLAVEGRNQRDEDLAVYVGRGNRELGRVVEVSLQNQFAAK